MKNKTNWKKTIQKRKLGGYHILAGAQLQKQLMNLIGISHGLLAIPHYLIVNKGKIVVLDAYRPSDFINLKDSSLCFLMRLKDSSVNFGL